MYVVQRVDASDEWHDVGKFKTLAEAQEFYLTRTPRDWHRIVRRVGAMDMIVR